jgi:hypothetical protein
MGASVSAHSDFISCFGIFDAEVVAAATRGQAFRQVRPREVVQTQLLCPQDLGRLNGSLLKVVVSQAPAYGEWVAVLPGATVTESSVEVTLLGSHRGKVMNVQYEALSNLISGVALGVLSDPSVREADPRFTSHGRDAVPLFSSPVLGASGLARVDREELPTRAFLLAPFEGLTLDSHVAGADAAVAIITQVCSVELGLDRVLPGAGALLGHGQLDVQLAAGTLRLRGGAGPEDQWVECATVGHGHWLYLRGDCPQMHPVYFSVYYRCVGTGECSWEVPEGGCEVLGVTLSSGPEGEQFVEDGNPSWSRVYAAPSPQYMWVATDLEDGTESAFVNLYDRRRVCHDLPRGGVIDYSEHPGLAVLSSGTHDQGLGGFRDPTGHVGHPLADPNDAVELAEKVAFMAMIADFHARPGGEADPEARSRSGSEQGDGW